jgi:beta-glucosidase
MTLQKLIKNRNAALKYVTFIFLFALLVSDVFAQQNKVEAKINALVKQMTLEEKVGQMAQFSVESLG